MNDVFRPKNKDWRTGGRIPHESRQAVARRYGCLPGHTIKARCFYCGAKGIIEWPLKPNGKPRLWVGFGNLTLDHVTPRVRGGSHDPSNLVLACGDCNRSKYIDSPEDWKKRQKANEKKMEEFLANYVPKDN